MRQYARLPRGLLLRVGPILMAVLAVAGCGEADQSRHGAIASKDAVGIVRPGTEDAADSDWTELTSSGPRPARLPGEESLAYFMRQVELSDIRRRNLGLRFWNRYPEDSRRYKWLLLTVHMPPHYAQDIQAWAENETRTEPNAAPVDVKGLQQWEDLYRRMRAAFWKAPEVTDQERRFLWFGELEQQLLRLQEAQARGEVVDADALLADILAFAKAYPQHFSQNDAKEHMWNVRTLIRLATVENGGAFEWSSESLAAYAERLIETGNKAAVQQWELLQTAGQLPQLFPSGTSEVERAWRSLPESPSDQPTTLAGFVIYFHDDFISSRKYRDIGMRLLTEYPNHKRQLSWIYVTNDNPPIYATHFVDAIRQAALGKMYEIEQDEEAVTEWKRVYGPLRAEVWNDPRITDEERGDIRGFELWSDLWRLQAVWKQRRDRVAIERFLDEIHALYKDYGNVGDVERISSVLLREYKAYGLNDDRLLSFFSPMRNYDAEALRKLAKAAQNQIALRATPFELAAPTMAGEPFDIANLRGKIVLVDHWTTRCSSCIAAMPSIHNIYLDYKDKGFEVVSVCYNGDEERERVTRVKREMDLTWTTLAADGLWPEVAERYGYQGVPQYMLLNRDGTLYAGTGEVDMGRNLRALLDEMLAKEAEGGAVEDR